MNGQVSVAGLSAIDFRG